jgi:hypothetical protein
VRLLARTLRLASEIVALDSTKIPSPLKESVRGSKDRHI